eukprot:COSAG02_NODE_210_length_28878_cov_133.787136_2_plen_193_part_00
MEAYDERMSSLVVGAAVFWTRHDSDAPKDTVGVIVQASDTPDGPRRLVRFNQRHLRIEAQQLELADANLLPKAYGLEQPLLGTIETSDKTQDGVLCCRPVRECMRKIAECCGDTCKAASTCVCMPLTLIYRCTKACWQHMYVIGLFILASLLVLELIWFVADSDCELLSFDDTTTSNSGNVNDVGQSFRLKF